MNPGIDCNVDSFLSSSVICYPLDCVLQYRKNRQEGINSYDFKSFLHIIRPDHLS